MPQEGCLFFQMLLMRKLDHKTDTATEHSQLFAIVGIGGKPADRW